MSLSNRLGAAILGQNPDELEQTIRQVLRALAVYGALVLALLVAIVWKVY